METTDLKDRKLYWKWPRVFEPFKTIDKKASYLVYSRTNTPGKDPSIMAHFSIYDPELDYVLPLDKDRFGDEIYLSIDGEESIKDLLVGKIPYGKDYRVMGFKAKKIKLEQRIRAELLNLSKIDPSSKEELRESTSNVITSVVPDPPQFGRSYNANVQRYGFGAFDDTFVVGPFERYPVEYQHEWDRFNIFEGITFAKWASEGFTGPCGGGLEKIGPLFHKSEIN